MDILSAWEKKSRQIGEFYQEEAIQKELQYISPEFLHELFTPTKDLFGISIGDIHKNMNDIVEALYKLFNKQNEETSFVEFIKVKLAKYPHILAYIMGMYDLTIF